MLSNIMCGYERSERYVSTCLELEKIWFEWRVHDGWRVLKSLVRKKSLTMACLDVILGEGLPLCVVRLGFV
jgi:hypothetical protein